MHGQIQGLGTALLNAFRLECSLPRKKETKIFYFVILISKCHTDYMCVCMCIWTSCFAEDLLYFVDNIKVCLGKKVIYLVNNYHFAKHGLTAILANPW